MARGYIGVYNADGGVLGEAKYILGHLLGRAHCALCDITHSPVRRKKAWDEMVAGLGVPFRLYHLNEMPADVAEVVARSGSPVVLERVEQGLRVVLNPDELQQLDGSVAAFERRLTHRAADDSPAEVTGPHAR